ncbi:DUF2946 family protein [Ramlibacter humi]|nr:DUF2946 family protein [Ramlibacter humi]
MQRLRHARFLARLVLAWFALSLGVAIASPLVQPKAMQLVCSGAAMKVVFQDGGDDGQAPTTHKLDCPLCAAASAPPPVMEPAPVVQPLGRAVQSIPAAETAALTAAPLPARGPPSFS